MNQKFRVPRCRWQFDLSSKKGDSLASVNLRTRSFEELLTTECTKARRIQMTEKKWRAVFEGELTVTRHRYLCPSLLLRASVVQIFWLRLTAVLCHPRSQKSTKLRHIQPRLRHEGMARHGGMDPVLRPVLRRRRWAQRLVKHGLKRYKQRARRLCCRLRHRAPFVELGEPGIVDGTATKHERLANHQGCLGQGVARAGQQRIEARFLDSHSAIVLARARMPHVIHADENTQQCGLQVNRIGLPARIKIGHLVAADAAIVALQRFGRMGAQ